MEKIEYIVNQLKKTFGKKYENYCVTRIINKLDNRDIKFITQQMFKRSDGRIALADLYFPQVNVWVEIDEEHHIYQTKDDRIRTEEVRKNDIRKRINQLEDVKFNVLEEPDRIEIFDSSGILRKDIDVQIDMIVDKIKSRILNLGDDFKPWINVFNTPQYYIKKGYIDVTDSVKFSTLKEVSDLFNKKYNKGNRHNYFSINELDNIYCWCPKVKIEANEFKNIPYENIIINNGEYILESSKQNNDKFLDDAIECDEIRYAFCYYKDESLKYMYKFRGVYKLDKEKSIKLEKRAWKHIGDTVDISCYFK